MCKRRHAEKGAQLQEKRDIAPTVHNDAVMIRSTIDAHENRDLMTIHCPGAFLKAMASDPVIMQLRVALAEALVLIDLSM